MEPVVTRDAVEAAEAAAMGAPVVLVVPAGVPAPPIPSTSGRGTVGPGRVAVFVDEAGDGGAGVDAEVAAAEMAAELFAPRGS